MKAFREGWAWTPRDWTGDLEDTGTGDPRAATPEKGKRYLDAVVGKIAVFLAEFARTTPEALYT